MVTLTQLPNSWPDIASFGPTLKSCHRENTKAFKFDIAREDNSHIVYDGTSDLEDLGIASSTYVGNLHCSNRVLVGTVFTDYTIEDSFALFAVMGQSSQNYLSESAEADTTPLINLGFAKRSPGATKASGFASGVLKVSVLHEEGEIICTIPCTATIKFARADSRGATSFEIVSTVDINQLSSELSRLFSAASNVLTANFGTIRISGTTHFELDISGVK